MIGLSRRLLLAGSLLAAGPGSAAEAADAGGALRRGVADLERRHGGHIGIAILDTATMKAFAHRGGQRFPLCSTYKFLAAAFVLARVDRKQESLSRRIFYTKHDLVAYSPVTEKHVGTDGLTLGEICDAAVTLSDNTAGNLLLDSFGGPPALTGYLRSLGDRVTRLDRKEPALNEARPGDPRDTTTPMALAETLRKITLGDSLSSQSRAQLIGWLVGDKVGDKRLRAGVPKDWQVGDKTGTGERNATNDVAVFWPPGRAPIVVMVFYIDARASSNQRDTVLADVGRLVTARFAA